MASVLLSRVLGLFREWTVAHQIGSNSITDAYYAAFTLPDFLNYLIAGGSLSVTFIPVFAMYVAEKNEDEGWRAFSTVMSVMGVVLVALVSLAEIFAPQLVKLIAPGFDPAERQRVIFLTRIMLPAQICFYEGSILSAVQYAKSPSPPPRPSSITPASFSAASCSRPASASPDSPSAFSAAPSSAIFCCRFMARTAPAQNSRPPSTSAILAFGCS